MKLNEGGNMKQKEAFYLNYGLIKLHSKKVEMAPQVGEMMKWSRHDVQDISTTHTRDHESTRLLRNHQQIINAAFKNSKLITLKRRRGAGGDQRVENASDTYRVRKWCLETPFLKCILKRHLDTRGISQVYRDVIGHDMDFLNHVAQPYIARKEFNPIL